MQHALDDALTFARYERCRDDGAYSLALGIDLVGNVVHAVASDLGARYGRVCAADAREEQFQIVVYLGRCADGRAGVARRYLLFDCYGRRNALDHVDVGLAYAAEELPGVCRKALDITALSLGEYGVEGKSRLARSRKTRYDGQRLVGDRKLDVFKVVDACALDMYGVIV